ncbi:hypothetical protein ACVWZK_008601 [Bradyrhizobium sp. GM0.4]
MRSEVRLWRATTIALVASGAANPADLEPAVNMPRGLWGWTEGLDCVLVGGQYGGKSFSDYGPSIDRDVSDTSGLLQDSNICDKRKLLWRRHHRPTSIEVGALTRLPS